jgi:hypothetical protein
MRSIARIAGPLPLAVVCGLGGFPLPQAPATAEAVAEVRLVAISSLTSDHDPPGRVRVQLVYRCTDADPAELSVTIDGSKGTDRTTIDPACDDHSHSVRTDPIGIDLSANETVQLTALLTTAGRPLAVDDRSVVLTGSPP